MIAHCGDELPQALFGSKALQLKRLYDLHYRVPAFVAVSHEAVARVLRDDSQDKVLREVVTCVDTRLTANRYAVRSASFMEDGVQHSHAGKFKTVLNVSISELSDALLAVAQDAVEKTDTEQPFSIFVQEYIPADYAGVLFTRNPLGGREVVLEYTSGTGEGVVGGTVAEHDSFLLQDAARASFRYSSALSSIGARIETLYGFPQDVEWAVKDGEVFVLQTRHITSITQAQWEGIQYLERELGDRGAYLYEKTPITETFTRPSPLALSMVRKFFESGGPLARAYRSIGVTYQPVDQFKVFGNELLIDREAETKSVFPALSHVAAQSHKPRIARVSGGMRTIKNTIALARVRIPAGEVVLKDLHDMLKVSLDPREGLKERLRVLLEGYELVYRTNIYTQKATTQLKKLLRSDESCMSELLSAGSDLCASLYPQDFGLTAGTLVGNSLSLDDRSPFQAVVGGEVESATPTLDTLLHTLPAWKREAVRSSAITASEYVQLRELARWVSVRYISYVRESIDEREKKLFPEKAGLLYCATLEEILQDKVDGVVCEARRTEHVRCNDMTMPSVIASFTVDTEQGGATTRGISPGTAKGIVVSESEMQGDLSDKILCTTILAPSIAEFLPRIRGVVTAQGGLLSHMAIVARELGVPVVVVPDVASYLGQQVTIDGTTGKVVVNSARATE